MVRYGAAGVGFHIVGAVVATILVMWAGLRIPLRRPALLLLSLTFSQVFLGLGAYMARVVNVAMPQPMPLTDLVHGGSRGRGFAGFWSGSGIDNGAPGGARRE